uniref:Secreted protein n=1 Tax=Steinernema glaseri TaxID=37863 RepID=A0A1I7Z7D3_9BILA
MHSKLKYMLFLISSFHSINVAPSGSTLLATSSTPSICSSLYLESVSIVTCTTLFSVPLQNPRRNGDCTSTDGPAAPQWRRLGA